MTERMNQKKFKIKTQNKLKVDRRTDRPYWLFQPLPKLAINLCNTWPFSGTFSVNAENVQGETNFYYPLKYLLNHTHVLLNSNESS